ncbi:MAG: hypothetical protein ACTSXZ_08835 [Alphaproteobacteria bacterium]
MDQLEIFGFIDDAFISFRYARNLADGHGLVYNIGERVEGYSNTLFVLLLALLARLGMMITTAATWLGIIFHAGTVALALAYMRRVLSEPLLRPLPMFALLFLILHPSEIAYALSGMEASMAAFWLLLAIHLVTAAVERGRAVILALLAGLVTFLLGLTRPEAIAMAAPLGLWLLLGNKEGRWGRAIPYGLAVAVLYGAFLLWRHSYFGDWQPNTYYAKAYGAGLTLLLMGIDYLWRYANIAFVPYLLVAFVLLAVRFRAKLPGWWYGMAGVALTYLAVIAYVGGDHFPLARFLIPVSPLLVILLAETGRRVRDAINAVNPVIAKMKLRTAAWIAIGLLLPIAVAFAMLFRNEGLIFAGQVRKAQAWCYIGQNLAEEFPPDTSIGLIPIGAIGYCSKLPVVDIVGLTDAHIARSSTDLSRSMAGHGRYDSEYVLAEKKPKLVLALIDLIHLPVPEWFMRAGVQHLAMRDLIQRREFIDAYAFHRMKVGEKRYFHYWSRRDFEPPETHPGDYPIEGMEAVFPEREPLTGETLREKIWGVQDKPTESFKVPEGWEVW